MQLPRPLNIIVCICFLCFVFFRKMTTKTFKIGVNQIKKIINSEQNESVSKEENKIDIIDFAKKYKDKLGQLKTMGFVDLEKNILALEKNNGNTFDTIQELLK